MAELEKYILKTKSHEDWRNYLLVNSFFFAVLIQHLRKKLVIPSSGIGSATEIILWERKNMQQLADTLRNKSKGGTKSVTRQMEEYYGLDFVIRQKLFEPIYDSIEKFHNFNLNFELLKVYVLGHTSMSFPGSSKVLLVTSPRDPITETGVYIKYTHELTNKEVANLKKQAEEGYQTLSRIKGFKIEGNEKSRKAPKPDSLEVYLTIEKYLIEEKISKPNSFNINPIFEIVAEKLKSKPGTVRRKYYSIINNFQLPSLHEVSLIPIN